MPQIPVNTTTDNITELCEHHPTTLTQHYVNPMINRAVMRRLTSQRSVATITTTITAMSTPQLLPLSCVNTTTTAVMESQEGHDQLQGGI